MCMCECVWVFMCTHVYLNKIDIFPTDLPQLPDKIILEEGENLRIDCTPTSSTTLQWAVDGMVLSEMGSVFVIDEAVPSNSGTYSCSAFGVTRQVPVYILPGTCRSGTPLCRNLMMLLT